MTVFLQIIIGHSLTFLYMCHECPWLKLYDTPTSEPIMVAQGKFVVLSYTKLLLPLREPQSYTIYTVRNGSRTKVEFPQKKFMMLSP